MLPFNNLIVENKWCILFKKAIATIATEGCQAGKLTDGVRIRTSSVHFEEPQCLRIEYCRPNGAQAHKQTSSSNLTSVNLAILVFADQSVLVVSIHDPKDTFMSSECHTSGQQCKTVVNFLGVLSF